MRFVVTCRRCRGVKRIAEYPDRAGAEECVRRHHTLRGHEATIFRELDTPFEGLL